MASRAETLDTDICVIGAGPAGLTVASVVASAGCDIILLESGTHVPNAFASALNEGIVAGDAYAGLRETRERRVGGTASRWNTRFRGVVGAKYVPLDPIDLEPRDGFELTGWPFEYDELVPYYRRAQDLCGIGEFAYDCDGWQDVGRAPLGEIGPELESRVYQWGSRDAFIGRMLRSIERAGNVRVYPGATVTRLETGPSPRRVVQAHAARPGGGSVAVRAKHFVVAGGAVENARLLLCSGHPPRGLGNESGWVGRCFMEHPRDRSLLLRPRKADQLRRLHFYDLHGGSSGAGAIGRLAIARTTMRKAGLLNASVTLLPRVRPSMRRARDLAGSLTRLSAVDALLPRGGFGWSAHPAPSLAFDAITVLVNLEQAPNPANRVVLGDRCDALGVPVPRLEWRWRDRDDASRRAVRELVGRALERCGLGRVETGADCLDPNAHHHAGTTRMHRDARQGVVDPHGRVHALDNLHVAGASVFPTAGFANPVLTIVALAIRLGERVHSLL